MVVSIIVGVAMILAEPVLSDGMEDDVEIVVDSMT